MDTTRLAPVAAALRANFLLLTPLCVLVGVAIALRNSGQVDALEALLALFGALLAHAAVNLLNEYDDFRSGLDAIAVRTPYSGGSGALPGHPEAAPAALVAGSLALVATAAVGVYFVASRGWAIMPLGLLGLIVIVAYTPWITRRPLVCLVAPGLGFGPLMVLGVSFALTGAYAWNALWASLVPFFLVSALLLINQFPDLEADRAVGRRHLPIAVGRPVSARIYAVFLLAPSIVIVAGLVLGQWPLPAVLGLLPLPAAFYLARGVVRHAEDRDGVVSLLGMNVAVVLGTLLLFGAGILLG